MHDILGGAGSYSALGARLLSPGPLSKSVGWIVDCGSDFPDKIKQVIERWDTSCLMRGTPERLTTRGWNGYEGTNDHRAFRYLTPKLRLEAKDLSSSLLASKSFHVICSPSRCSSMVQEILDKRVSEPSCSGLHAPLIIWEPVPDLCVPEELEACYATLKLVDVVSPNHEELAGFFGEDGNIGEDKVNRELIEQCAANWLKSGVGKDRNGSVVVRAGKDGCYLVNGKDPGSKGKWLPAYHQSSSEKVVDPTGGGNTFLGAMAVSLARGRTLEESAIYASVAASFAIEQVGVPQLDEIESKGGGRIERWNGDVLQDRLEKYLRLV